MFQNLRTGSPLYILHRSEPKLCIGEILNVTLPIPQMDKTYTAGVYNQPKTTVDIKVKVGDETIEYQKIPSEKEIADFGTSGMILSENRESILTEIELLKKSSENILNSIDKHQGIVSRCNSMIEELKPEIKQEAERMKEMDNMRNEMKEIKEMLSKVLNEKE